MSRFVSALVLFTLAGLVYVYTEVEAVQVGYTIRKQEEAKVQALDRGRALRYNIARMKAPNNLERRLSAQKIVLDSPKAWQTLVFSNGELKVQPLRPQNLVQEPPFFAKFFIGTAQAEAKDN